MEKRLTSTLLEPSSVEKIMEVDSHIGAAVSGLIGGKQETEDISPKKNLQRAIIM